MNLSIRLWIILALNAVVISITLALGWIAQDVAGRVVEERLATDMVGRISTFMSGRSFPLSDTTLSYLKQMLQSDWIVVDSAHARIASSSLAGPQAAEFTSQLPRINRTGAIQLAGDSYRFESHDMPHDGDASSPDRLYVLIPSAEFQSARHAASQRVIRLILPLTVASTLLAVLLAFVATRPIRRLTDEIAGIARQERDANREGAVATESLRRRELLTSGPRETRLLAESFYSLMDRLESARLRLLQSDRLATLGRICLSVAHELRNPLSGIKMNMRVLQDRISPRDDPGVDAILREIERMGLYLDELMSLAPGHTTNTTTPALAPVRLSALAESVLTILAGRCRHANVEIERNYPTDEPLVSADPNQIRQAMMNFIVNAIEAMPTGGRLIVGVRAGSQRVQFNVADTGAGVHAANTDIFEAFSSQKPNGVGLGLYLSREIVRRHGGDIGYENLAKGASFWFDLQPLKDRSSANSIKLSQ